MKKVFNAVRDILKEYYHLITFAVFFVLEAYSISTVVMTGDDFYYASFLKNGSAYFFSENILHYMETNGRALVHVLDEIFLAMPLMVWKFVELFAVSAIVLISAIVASGGVKNQKKFKISLVMSCALFSMIDLFILRETVLWVTGSFNYVLPVLLVLVFYRVFTGLAEKEKGAWYLPIIALLAACTTEQSSCAAVLVCMFVVVKTALVEKRKIKLTHILAIPASLVGFALLFLAPGNSARKALYPEFYAQSLADRLVNNTRGYFANAFDTPGMLFFFVLLSALSAFDALAVITKMTKEEIRAKGGTAKMLFHVLLFVCSFITVIALVLQSPIFPGTYIRLGTVAFLVIFTSLLQLVLLCARFLRREDDGSALIFALCSVVTFGAIVFGPIYGSRVFFAPIVFMFVPIIYMAHRAFEVKFACTFIPFCVTCYASYIFTLRYHAFVVLAYTVFLIEVISKLKKYRPSAVIAVGASFVVLLSIGRGYANNAQVHRYNDAVTAQYVEKGETDEPLTLLYPLQANYTYSLPYSNPYHLMRYKQYHGIPENAEIVYKTVAQINEEKAVE